MRTMQIAALAAAALALTTAAVRAQGVSGGEGVRPPDGTYRYVIRENGTRVGESAVEIRTAAGVVTVSETLDAGPVHVLGKTVYGGGPLQLQTYSAEITGSGAPQSVSGALSGGVLSLRSGSSEIRKSPADGAPIMLVYDDFVGSKVLLPSLLAQNGTAKFSAVALEGGAVLTGQSQVAADGGEVDVDLGGKAVRFTVDKRTRTVQRVDIPAESVTIELQP
jgi:hypothetical protein